MEKDQAICSQSVLQNSWKEYYQSKILDCGRDQKQLFAVTHSLLGTKNQSALPSFSTTKEVATQFAEFFHQKVKLITDGFQNDSYQSAPTHVADHVRVIETFTQVSTDYIRRLVRSMPSKSCSLDDIYPRGSSKNVLIQWFPL